LHGTVFVGPAPVLVELAVCVPFVRVAPPIKVNDFEVSLRVICESVDDAVSVPVSVAVFTVLCRVFVTYVYCDPLKSEVCTEDKVENVVE
jgi:hypothetical protein